MTIPKSLEFRPEIKLASELHLMLIFHLAKSVCCETHYLSWPKHEDLAPTLCAHNTLFRSKRLRARSTNTSNVLSNEMQSAK